MSCFHRYYSGALGEYGHGIKVGFLVGARRLPSALAFELDALNTIGEKRLATKKEFVVILGVKNDWMVGL